MCASEHSAFLSTWLPSEERRRWRRPGPKSAQVAQGLFQRVKRFFNRWLGDGELESTDRTLRTRASDHVPNLHFDPPAQEPKKPPAQAQEPVSEPK